jgi:hypothetical protein
MGRIRSITAQSPAIVISVLALALSLGGGAYASTQLAGHSQSSGSVTGGVTWTSLTLVNGWASENHNDGSGNPKVALQSNIVYLSGSLGQAIPGSDVFSTMPLGFRPTHNMWITVFTSGGAAGTLFIGSNGTMTASSSASCGSGTSAQCFTSLAGVSFPINS